LRSLSLQRVQCSGGNFGRVEFAQQRLECDHFTRRNSARENRTQLLADRFLAVAGAPLGTVQIERRDPAAGELTQPGDFTGRGESKDLNWLGRGDPLQLPRRDGRLIKND
jgi:hypothetical protein